jgi:DNA polymerase III subunit beta
MKIKIKQKELSKVLKNIASVVKSINTLPILDNIKVDVDDTGLYLSATNLETYVTKHIDCEVIETGSLCANAKVFKNIINNIHSEELILVHSGKDTLHIETDNFKYNFEVFGVDEYPIEKEVEKQETIFLPATDIKKALQATIPFTSNNDIEPNLFNIFFDASEGLNIVSTDRNRLSMYTLDAEIAVQSSAIISKGTLSFLSSLISDADESELELIYGDDKIQFTYDGYTISGNKIDAKYPNYRIVFPKDHQVHIKIDKTHLIESLKRIIVVAPINTFKSEFKFGDGMLEILTKDLDYTREGIEKIPCEVIGDAIKVGFNTKLFFESVNAIDGEEINILIQMATKGVVIYSDESHKMIVMPVRLED